MLRHTNLMDVSLAAWAQLVTEPVNDVDEFIGSLSEEPVVVTHWGVRYRLSALMRFVLSDKFPEALP